MGGMTRASFKDSEATYEELAAFVASLAARSKDGEHGVRMTGFGAYQQLHSLISEARVLVGDDDDPQDNTMTPQQQASVREVLEAGDQLIGVITERLLADPEALARHDATEEPRTDRFGRGQQG